MKYVIVSFLSLLFFSCASFQPKQFSNPALEEKLITLERDSISFGQILQQNKGKELFIQLFASYCPISQDSFDDVLAYQKKHPEKVYIFLSVDHSYYDWKRGLKYVKPKGKFYYIPKKGEGDLGAFLKLKSIPRFIMVDANGKIQTFKSHKVKTL